MRSTLTLALLACAAAPAAAQTTYYYPQQGGQTYPPTATYGRQVVISPRYAQAQPSVVVSTPRVYVQSQPRVAYSYVPSSYSQPSYQTAPYPQTYSYTVQVPAQTTQPRVVYSTPQYVQPTYSTPSYTTTTPQTVYSTPTYTTPTYRATVTVSPSYSSSPTTVVSGQPIYSTPSYSTQTVYSSPSSTVYSTPSYSTPVYSTPQTYSIPVNTTPVYSQPVTWSQPSMSYSSYPTTMAYNSQPSSWSSYPTTMTFNQPTWSQPQMDNVVWSQPSYGTMSSWSQPSYSSMPSVTYGSTMPSYSRSMAQSQQVPDVIVANPFQTQPTLNFVPSGDYSQRLQSAPPATRGYAGRRMNNYYR